MPNRHRKKAGEPETDKTQEDQPAADAQQAEQVAPSVLRHRGENKVDSKDFLLGLGKDPKVKTGKQTGTFGGHHSR